MSGSISRSGIRQNPRFEIGILANPTAANPHQPFALISGKAETLASMKVI